MELCYEGKLVMPKNFIAINGDEMEYIDGGAAWKFTRLTKNLRNLAGTFAIVKTLASQFKYNGKTMWAWITGAATMAQATAKSAMAAFAVKIGVSIATVSRVLAAAAIIGGAAAVVYLGKYNVF